MTRPSLSSPRVRRSYVQCLLLHVATRWLICGLLLWPLLAPLAGSNLLTLARGDDELLLRGASTLVTLLLSHGDELGAAARRVLIFALLALLVKLWLSCVTFNAMVQGQVPGSRDNLRDARRLLAPFAWLMVASVIVPATCIGMVGSLLPVLGSLLLPLLGEQNTDLVELGLAGALACGWLALSLVCEVTRVCLAARPATLRAALRRAWSTLGRQRTRFLLAAVPRLTGSLLLGAFGLFASMRAQLGLHGPAAPVAAWLSTEAFTLLSTWLYLNWVARAATLVDTAATPKPNSAACN